jgi:hypothetical protein
MQRLGKIAFSLSAAFSLVFASGQAFAAQGVSMTGSRVSYVATPVTGGNVGHNVSLSVTDTAANSQCAGSQTQADLRNLPDPVDVFWNCGGNGTTQSFSVSYSFGICTRGCSFGAEDYRSVKVFAINGNNGIISGMSPASICERGRTCA